jgi:hypothetical protein
MADASRGMNEEPGTGRPALSVPPNTPPLMLAARLGIDGEDRIDVAADATGMVAPGTGGVSVSRSWVDMPSFTVPKRLRHAYGSRNFRVARGGPHSRIWSHPVAAFADGAADAVAFAPELALRVDGPGHGLIEPAGRMSPDRYQTALANTRATWTINEPTMPHPRPPE